MDSVVGVGGCAGNFIQWCSSSQTHFQIKSYHITPFHHPYVYAGNSARRCPPYYKSCFEPRPLQEMVGPFRPWGCEFQTSGGERVGFASVLVALQAHIDPGQWKATQLNLGHALAKYQIKECVAVSLHLSVLPILQLSSLH